MEGVPIDKARYERLIGKLIYLSHIRPNIAYVVSIGYEFMHAPLEDHMETVMRILKYVKATLGKRLLLSKNNHMHVEAYTDADYRGSMIDRRSSFGYCAFVGGHLVTMWGKK